MALLLSPASLRQVFIAVGGTTLGEVAEISVYRPPQVKPLSLPFVWREEIEVVPCPQGLLT